MAVNVPGSIDSSIVSEYAATSIRINRNLLKDTNGFLVSGFTVNIDYEKKVFVIDANRNKLGIVVDQDTSNGLNIMPGFINNDRGSINLDTTLSAQYFSKVCHEGDILGELIANLADELIHQDLIKRDILKT